MFNFDWFHRGGLQKQIEEARNRCARKRLALEDAMGGGSVGRNGVDYETYRSQLETRTILYLKDGLSYEMKEIADIGMSSALAFECVPVDESYQVGSYVIVVPFEDIARVEVYAVHPDEKPTENLRIPGFRAAASDQRETP